MFVSRSRGRAGLLLVLRGSVPSVALNNECLTAAYLPGYVFCRFSGARTESNFQIRPQAAPPNSALREVELV